MVSTRVMRWFVRGALICAPERWKVAAERKLRGWLDVWRVKRADCVVVSYSKSGRTWLRVLLSKFYQIKHELPEFRILAFDNLNRRDPLIPKLLFTHDTYTADALGNSDPKAIYRDKRVVLLVRHPGDTAVSNFFQWKYRTRDSKVGLIGLPHRDRDVSLFDFVMSSTRGLPSIIRFMNGWHDELNRLRSAHLVRYEDLRANPKKMVEEILSFIGTSWTDAQVAEAVAFASFENMKALTEQDENGFGGDRLVPRDRKVTDSYKVRRGKIGGYREYFDARQAQMIDDLIDRELDQSFGYRSDAVARELEGAQARRATRLAR